MASTLRLLSFSLLGSTCFAPFCLAITALAVSSAKAVDQVDSSYASSLRSRELDKITYYPGQLTVKENGLLLSQGLTAKIIGRKGEVVDYDIGGSSVDVSHAAPDYGATFVDPRKSNKGGWIYMSNSENRARGSGGVGAFTFDKKGNLIEYKRALSNTTSNCGGGYTPWQSYITCEETTNGRIYQVDPAGIRKAEIITMGLETNGGSFESFSSYTKNASFPQFFATEDTSTGVVRRFVPDSPNWEDPWTMLTGTGSVDYLLVDPVTMTYSWTTDLAAARSNAKLYFPNTEGIDQNDKYLYFVTKVFKSMYVLDLELNTYINVTTLSGAFNGQPDQVINLLGKTKNYFEEDQWLFFTEDGESNAGIFARNKDGDFYTILENANPNFKDDETTGLYFSPDGMHMYFALQGAGLIYDVTRLDGRAFQAKNFNVMFHASAEL
ncbi:hypothetical protein MPSEU_000994800 [Mayamaea pseudoterrestris]|nr:hypothetical protein MPSEU_000994800 [Mayamaea pseudoterrestris]